METQLTPYTATTSIPAKSVLVFAPHPDDEAIGCGGLIAAYAQENIPVDVIFLSSGEFGEHGAAGPAAREAESQAAGRKLSVRQQHWWREPDRGVKYHEDIIAKAVASILEAGADLLLCPGISEIHPDHRTTAWLVIEAARRVNARGHTVNVALYEVGAPLHYVNILIDISRIVETKRAAIQCYTSQLALYSYDDLILGLNQFRSYPLGNAVPYVEAYRLLTVEELRQPGLLAEPELQRQERLDMVSIRQDCTKVTILIRSMGRESLSRALDSVALQTWPNVEVLLLNARGQGHPDAATKAGGFPVRFIDNDHGLGRPAAANALLQQADSEFALFLDDDDWIAPDHISSLMAALRQAPSAAAATSGVEMGVLTGNSWQPEHTFNDSFDRYRLLFENYLPIHSVLFRLPDVRDKYHCRFDTELEVFEDWDFWLQLSRHAGMVSTGHVSAYYCRNETDGSDVFSPSSSNQAQLGKFRTKWFGAFNASEFEQLLVYVQQQYRGRNSAELRLASEITRSAELTAERDSMKAIILARENEIENFKQHVSGLNSILAEKDIQLAKEETNLAEKDMRISELTSALEHTRFALTFLQESSSRRLWLLRRLIKPNK